MAHFTQAPDHPVDTPASARLAPAAKVPTMRIPSPLCIDPAFAGLARFMQEQIPFNKHLQMRVEHLGAGSCVLRVPWSEVLIGDPTRPAVHGGVLSTLIDTTGGAAVFSRLTRIEDRVSTVDLRVDYLRPGPSEDLWCFAHVVRMGNKVAVTRMHVYAGALPEHDEDEGALATGTAVYNVVRRSESAKSS